MALHLLLQRPVHQHGHGLAYLQAQAMQGPYMLAVYLGLIELFIIVSCDAFRGHGEEYITPDQTRSGRLRRPNSLAPVPPLLSAQLLPRLAVRQPFDLGI